MRLETTATFEEAGMGSTLFRHYYAEPNALNDFWPHSPIDTNWEGIIELKKNFPESTRKALLTAINNQYGSGITPKTKALLNKLESTNCFTVCTGHQLSFAGGPAYFFYKMISAIKLAEMLESKFPEIQVQPIYWMNSEDHDFAEINHFHFLGKTFELTSDKQNFPCGELKAGSAVKAFQDLRDSFPNLEAFEVSIKTLETAYTAALSLSGATRNLVQALLEPMGILVLDQADANLKRCFFPTLIKDFTENISYSCVEERIAQIREKGFEPQVSPREINYFFHHPEKGRKRWVFEENTYKVLETEIAVQANEIEVFLSENLHRISTNVVTRPLYQETILPNLAYLGGPAEVHYWLQYGSLFKAFNISEPAVLMRDSFLVLPGKMWNRLQGMGITISDLFLRPEDLEKRYLELNESTDLNEHAFLTRHQEVFADLSKVAGEYDPSLEAWTIAEGTRAAKSLETVFGRIKKATREKHQRNLKFLSDTQSKLFPNGSFQERYWNLLHLTSNPKEFLFKLIEFANPMNPGLKVIIED